jgi:NAD(P)-dependent dehydrogenase (short-subunit alcohol dehydrogenase family)
MAAFGPKGWMSERLPNLSGKTYAITGANSGIGYEAARMLGAKGAAVTILCRSKDKAAAAVSVLNGAAPAGKFDYILLNLADLSSVRAAANALRERHAKIDGLINNAGIMALPKRELTADGFETQLGVNHLGHFAFAGHLCDLVEAAGGRFVAVASGVHHFGRLNFDNLMLDRGYSPARAYAQSKLANLSYALELNRRLETAGVKARSYACHPGYSATNLQSTGPSRLAAAILKPMNAVFAQSAEKGALPTVLCAAGAEAEPGHYYGPTGAFELTGPVGEARIARQARDESAAAHLWEISETLTGVSWSILKGKGRP